MTTFLLLLLVGLPQASFTRFSYCREVPGGLYRLQCVELDAQGQGAFRFTTAEGDMVDGALALSTEAVAELDRRLEETDYLREGESYESGRNVANLGAKTLAVEGDWGLREAAFNYSTRDEVNALVRFLDHLVAQETLIFDLGVALDFDRLGIPSKLEEVQRELEAERIPDPVRLIPVLEQIAGDTRLVNFARTTATRLKEQIEERLADR